MGRPKGSKNIKEEKTQTPSGIVLIQMLDYIESGCEREFLELLKEFINTL